MELSADYYSALKLVESLSHRFHTHSRSTMTSTRAKTMSTHLARNYAHT